MFLLSKHFPQKKIIPEGNFLFLVNSGLLISFFELPEAEKGVFIFRPRAAIRPSEGILIAS